MSVNAYRLKDILNLLIQTTHRSLMSLTYVIAIMFVCVCSYVGVGRSKWQTRRLRIPPPKKS